MKKLSYEQVDQRVEKLLTLKKVYTIEPFLKRYPYESDFYSLEEYFLKNFLKDYYKSLSKILMRIICYYDSYIYLIEFAIDLKNEKYKKYEYKNFRKKGLKEILKVLKYVIFKGGTSMNIYIPAIDSLITIGSGFDTVVYSKDMDFIKDLKVSTMVEGLFLREIIEEESLI